MIHLNVDDRHSHPVETEAPMPPVLPQLQLPTSDLITIVIALTFMLQWLSTVLKNTESILLLFNKLIKLSRRKAKK